MKTTVKKRATQTRPHGAQIGQNQQRRCHIRQMGNEWAEHWNAGTLAK